ncbi:MAG: PilZ domain-containing protein [Terriglobales bacterium]
MALKTEPQTAFAETRRWRRFRFDVPVHVLLRRNARDVEFAGRGTGMNEGGIGVYVEAPLQAGDQVQVEFTPPYSGLTVSVRGTVRHAKDNLYGVEFLAQDAAEQQEVALFRRMLRSAAERLGE